MSSPPPLPTFLIIGAQKSATRWLRTNLGDHPDICAAPEEVAFFNVNSHYRKRGTGWYRQQFRDWTGERFVGESTPGYMMMRHRPELVASRIRETVPDVRLLAVLRDPVDRAQSAMVHHMKRGRIPVGTRLVDLVRADPPGRERFGLITGGWYAASLAPFEQLFGDQLQVLFHDDVRDQPSVLYRSALEHLGARPDHLPADLASVRFSNRADDAPDHANQKRLALRTRLRQALAPRPRPRHTAVRLPTEELTRSDRLEVFEFFRGDIEELEEMTGRDLSAWRPE